MEKLVKNEKFFYILIILSVFVGYTFSSFCGSLLQSTGISISGNDGLYRTEYIDKSTITEQNSRIEETTKDIGRTNQNIGTAADDIEELLRKQRQLLERAKQNLTGAVRINENTAE